MHCYWFWWTTANIKDDAHLSRHVLPYINKALDRKSHLLLDNKWYGLFHARLYNQHFHDYKKFISILSCYIMAVKSPFPSFECHTVPGQVPFWEILSDSTTNTYFPTCKPSNKTRGGGELSIYVSKPSHPTGKLLTVARVVIVRVTQFLVPQPNMITVLLHILPETDLISEHHNVMVTC